MPKLSQAKRHRRRLDLVGACAASNSFNQQNNPRKVSEESISTASSSLEDSSSSSDLPSTPVPSQSSHQRERASSWGDCSESASMPRLKRRKPSSCLTDLVSLASSSQQETQAAGESCAESTLTPKAPEAAAQSEPLTCISPIWGQFVDMILEHDQDHNCIDSPEQQQQQQQGQDDTLCFSFVGGSSTRAFTSKLPNSASSAGSWSSYSTAIQESSVSHRSASPHLQHDPYHNSLFLHRKKSKKQPRQQILSPSRMMAVAAAASSSTSSQGETDARSSSPPSSSSFVLQDPASLPEALSRLTV